jgi:hypothetical protein
VADDVVNEAGCGCETQLIEYPALVGADGLSAEVQFGCDLAAMPAGCKRQQDFGFLGREIGVGGARLKRTCLREKRTIWYDSGKEV